MWFLLRTLWLVLIALSANAQQEDLSQRLAGSERLNTARDLRMRLLGSESPKELTPLQEYQNRLSWLTYIPHWDKVHVYRQSHTQRNASLPELAPMYSQMKTVMEQYQKSMYLEKDKEVLTAFLLHLNLLEKAQYPYQSSVELALLYSALLDFILHQEAMRSIQAGIIHAPANTMKQGLRRYGIRYSSSASLSNIYQAFLSVLATPIHLADKMIEQTLRPLGYESIYRTLIYQLRVQLYNHQYLMLPTFADLGLMDFLQLRHLDITWLGLTEQQFTEADNAYNHTARVFPP